MKAAALFIIHVAALHLSTGTARPLRATEPNVEALLRKADDMMRGESSEGKVSMHVKTAHWDRTLTMEVWSQGTEKTLIRILAPPKERGTTTLKVGNQIWNYLPKVDRTIKVPASMMSGSWMGSHFTNDDLVKHTRLSDDFDSTLIGQSRVDDGQLYIIECIPKPDAPVVWGKVVVKIRAADELPEEVTYYDEDGQLVRTMDFSDIRELGGRRLPRRVKVIPADEPDEFTEINYEEMRFGVEHPEETFTLQALRR